MKQKQKRAKVPQQRRAPAEAVRHAPASAIVFRTNVICEDGTGKLIFLPAGQASPFRQLEDVPARLQGLIGAPQEHPNIVANDLQMVVPRARLEQEEQMIEELDSGSHLSDEVREALDERGAQYLDDVRARNAALEEAAARQDIDHDRLIAEHEAENTERFRQFGTML
jgi:hypothetical protein